MLAEREVPISGLLRAKIYASHPPPPKPPRETIIPPKTLRDIQVKLPRK